jgi:uncharacterized protein YqcC (DUF446 family)
MLPFFMQYPELNEQLNSIEAELRRLNLLTDPAMPIESVTTAFRYGQMSFEQWLGKVFLPNARKAVVTGAIPTRSDVGTAAMRNFDGDDRMDELVFLLGEFDKMAERFAVRAACRNELKTNKWHVLGFLKGFFGK